VRPVRLLALVVAAGAGRAGAQTMLDQEQRLIEIHSLLVAMPALQAPGALGPLQASLGLEVITIPTIDGTTGGKTQLTASDQASAFPRLRLALGLGVAGGWRAVVGVGWIPPVEVHQVSSSMLGLEAGLAWTRDRLSVGLRLHGEGADSRSPVTDPATRDELVTWIAGADLAAAWRLDVGPVGLQPYASVGVVRVDGTFTVTSDGHVLAYATTALTLSAGLRLALPWQLEVVVEEVASPGVLVHPSVLVAWVPQLGAPRVRP
jgi:hypothetical protein